MPKLIIDEQEIEVLPGTKVIEAAEQLGIMIPRFCYHPALGSVGACRMCAVKFLQGPYKGLQMSCMVDAADGMVISTTDEEAVKFRKYVIEWLMLNHPHDCPVCDEGGHCLLQDMTVSGGHGIRRYWGKKRTYHDQYLGPLIQHEMNRCIQCYRCSRFYQDFAGYRDLGVLQIGHHVYFGRYKEGKLESPFSGNLIDICPTGVYTDKPSRFIGRRWDYERSPSICLNCSLGCHTMVSARYREVIRQEARFSKTVNGYFICDRGRYGFAYADPDERPWNARVDGEIVSWEKAFQRASEKLDGISREWGPSAVACVGSIRSSLETQAALDHLCRTTGWQGPVYWLDADMGKNVKNAVSRLDKELAVSLHELEKADYILAVGVDPVNEAPMLALSMRQARRCGAKVVLMDPRPVNLPLEFDHLAISPQGIELCLALLIKESIDPNMVKSAGRHIHDFLDTVSEENRISDANREVINRVAKDLSLSRQPVIICGTQIVSDTVPGLAADYARWLNNMGKAAGLFYLMAGANAFGAAVLSDTALSFDRILTDIENNAVRALILVESDPYWHYPDRSRLERAVERLDLFMVMDYLDSPGSRNADVLLPVQTVYEAGGLFINQEGRIQQATMAYRGGRPISRINSRGHPSRSFRRDIPGGEAQAAWQVLAKLDTVMSGRETSTIDTDLTTAPSDIHPLFADLPPMDAFPVGGVRIVHGLDEEREFEKDRSSRKIQEQRPGDYLELITVEWTFGTEELSARSPYLLKMEKEPCFFLHSDDATQLSISDGDKIAVKSDGGIVRAKAVVAWNMAPGMLILPRHHKIAWQVLGASRMMIEKNRIVKVSEDE